MNRSNWKIAYAAIFAGEFLAIAGFAIAIPVIPFFLETIGIREQAALNAWTGAIQSASCVSLMVFAPIWGALGDHYGRKLMLLRAMFGGAVLVSVMSLSMAPWQLLVLRTVQGAFTGTVTAANVLTACVVPSGRVGFFLGLTQTAVFLGNTLGPMAGGFLHDAFGPRVAFLAAGASLALAGTVVLFLTYEVRPASRPAQFRFRDCVPDLGLLGRDRAFAALMAILFMLQFSASIGGPVIPLYVKSMTGNIPGVGSLSGTIIGITALCAAIAASLIGLVSGKKGYGRTMLLCLGASALFTVPQAFVTAPWQLLILRAAAGFCTGGVLPTVNALIVRKTPSERTSSAFGLGASVSSAGFALGPVVGALTATAFGYGSAFCLREYCSP